jgi:hypothetical protein
VNSKQHKKQATYATLDRHPDPSIVDRKKFIRAQTTFMSTGVYVHYLQDTVPYNNYWIRENQKCKEGVSIGIKQEDAQRFAEAVADHLMNECYFTREKITEYAQTIIEGKELDQKDRLFFVEEFTRAMMDTPLLDHEFNSNKVLSPEKQDQFISFFATLMHELLGSYCRITGLHYFYLNYCPILAYDEETGRKIIRLPDFIDMDYFYFLEVEAAQKMGQGMIIAKARRKGFSFKNAAMAVWYYCFVRESRTYIGAYLAEYSSATMRMVREMINFLNENTAWRRRLDPNQKNYVKCAFWETVDGVSVEYGFKSEIQTLTFKDNDSASIGKSADFFVFEEAGKWPNLIASYQLSMPLFRDGARMTGMPIIFGTGGDMSGATNDFAEMFYDPERYFLRAFKNVWDDGMPDKPCGFFISSTWFWPIEEKVDEITGEVLEYENQTVEMPDGSRQKTYEDGISNHEAAKEYFLKERAMMRETDSQATWEKYITQYPLMPREAFLRVNSNIFPVVPLSEWLSHIRTNKELSAAGVPMDIFRDVVTGRVETRLNPNLKPIRRFPHKDNEKLEGCVVIYELPFYRDDGTIPTGLYVAGTDPYDQDSSGTTSLGSTFIYKQYNTFSGTYSRIVAEYTGRPELANQSYEQTLLLLELYGCQTLYENQLTGLKTYAQNSRRLHLLKEQPGIIKSISPNSKVSRGYGIHMSTQIKRQAELYLRDWLLEPRGQTEDGKTIYNYMTILSVPLLEELIAYNPESGNYDRVMAILCLMLHIEDNQAVVKYIDRPKNSDPFFQKKIYVRDGATNEIRGEHVRPHNSPFSQSSFGRNGRKGGPFFN